MRFSTWTPDGRTDDETTPMVLVVDDDDDVVPRLSSRCLFLLNAN